MVNLCKTFCDMLFDLLQSLRNLFKRKIMAMCSVCNAEVSDDQMMEHAKMHEAPAEGGAMEGGEMEAPAEAPAEGGDSAM